MSGGHFEYKQWVIGEIADSIEEYIYGHECDDCDVAEAENELRFNKERLFDNEIEEYEYIVRNRHTVPNRNEYDRETMRIIRLGLKIIRKASVYAQRIDWLLSGDDGEENFKKRLKEELEKI